SLFIIGHMGLFFYTQKGSIISTVVLPTTEIIEPFFYTVLHSFLSKKGKKGWSNVILILLRLFTNEGR
ncbi:hypothetical protein F6P87_10770, partial [Streptococcus suis]|nr:hypothetical protein [Streptococcus suis]MBS8108549.1 hypothetical protein [Streptococcus suis]MBS8117453.1 hypothetical protein [Streptococcus suis]